MTCCMTWHLPSFASSKKLPDPYRPLTAELLPVVWKGQHGVGKLSSCEAHAICIDNGALPETNMAPKKWWLANYFPFGKPYFQVPC